MIAIIILSLLNSTTANINTIQISKFSIVEPNKELDNMPNVILLIGDGLGPEGIRAASLIEYGEEFGSIMDKAFPVQ